MIQYLFCISMFGCNTQSAPKQEDVTQTNHVKQLADTIIKTDIDKSLIHFASVGDMMLGTNFPDQSTLPPDAYALLKPTDSILQSVDICFGNAEGTFLNEGGISKGSGPNVYNFRQPEAYAGILKNAGFDFLSIANNHVYDFGAQALLNTMRVLESNGLKFAGTPESPFAIIEKNGVKIGLVAFAPHSGCINLNDTKSCIKLVKEVNEKVDILMVSFHAGAEGAGATHVPRKHEFFYDQDRGDVYEFAHAAIDAGADVVIGHGPHVPRAMELYKSRLIAYSLGNFCTYAKFNLKGVSGLAPLLTYTLNGKGAFVEGRIHSFKQIGEGGPIPDETNASAKLIKELSITDFPESPLKIDDTGFIQVK
jgi:hypothetical protein